MVIDGWEFNNHGISCGDELEVLTFGGYLLNGDFDVEYPCCDRLHGGMLSSRCYVLGDGC